MDLADQLRSRIDDEVTHDVHYYKPELQQPEIHGTSHISILDESGNAVSMTTSICH